MGVEKRPAEVAGGGGGAAGGGGRSHRLFPAAAGTGAGSGGHVGRRARAYAGGGGRVRERERDERSRKDAGEGLRESWTFKWAFPLFSLFMTTHILFFLFF